ncbi:GIY-YIG nuclease family protein [Candidatus Pelagibacter sp.]|nr:GIY-YIG nuclease family protein [Candidatus Pelagibacter sp.]
MLRPYFVYLIVTKRNNKLISYVGYTNNLFKRIKLHNSGKGAKFTRGNYWKLVYKKKYKTKSLAMKKEYLLKKNLKLRNEIKLNYNY